MSTDASKRLRPLNANEIYVKLLEAEREAKETDRRYSANEILSAVREELANSKRQA